MEQPQVVKRHSLATRITHWLGALAMFVLFFSGLQIFNASPNLDASDASNPSRRVLAFSSGTTQDPNAPVGTTIVLGHPFTTTHVLGYAADGTGGESPRAFPAWITMPGVQDLADGRRWHFFFAWVLVVCGIWYIVAGLVRHDLGLVILRPSDLPKLWPMQLYYLKLRTTPPPHGKYNPLQKLAYTIVLFVCSPLIVISGLALSPGVDALAGPLTTILGGRQFARVWHFVLSFAFFGFFFAHMFLVLSTGVANNLRSMITGRYRLKKYDGVGV